jgi:hypothetical protein
MLVAVVNQACSGGGCLATSETVIGVRVYDMQSHALICDANVRATKIPSGTQFNLLATTFPEPDTGKDCGYAGGTDPGRYEIQVSKGGFRTTSTTVDVPSNECPGGGVPQEVAIELTR